MSTILKTIDMDLALQRAAGNEHLARELFAMLLKELPIYRLNLLHGLDSNDRTKLLENVHKLHGSATYTGVPALKKAASHLELILKQGESDELQSPVTAVITEIDQVLAEARP